MILNKSRLPNKMPPLEKENSIIIKNSGKMKKIIFASGLFLVFIITLTLIKPNFIVNSWFIFTDSDYVIPKESKIFSFNPTVMNSGSGDWWIYGEDSNYYYYFTGNDIAYIKRSKKSAKKCDGFNPHDYHTWCGK